jgi:site-specific DNA-methyltransferase (adenine-specific)
MMKTRAPRNRTIDLTPQEAKAFSKRLLTLDKPVSLDAVLNTTICQDMQTACGFLPKACADLVFLDPPYNLNKAFNGSTFKKGSQEQYAAMLESWLEPLLPLLKPTASVLYRSDWNEPAARCSPVAGKYLTVRSRITWKREKGRGARANWKNCSEDIWFCTVSEDYTFNMDAVKLTRRVIAPYTTEDGKPKD